MVNLLLYSLVDDEKNTLGSPAILMAMQMRRCNSAHIARQSTTRASGGATECLHRGIIRTVSPRHVRHGHQRWQHNKYNKKNF